MAVVAHDFSKLAVVFNGQLSTSNPDKANFQARETNNRNCLGHFDDRIGYFITHLLVSSGKGVHKKVSEKYPAVSENCLEPYKDDEGFASFP